ncbi:MAG: helix-turn-helix transcriptional regulator [Rhodocyclaceae bacterium]|nr:helix-turn-helix transcriptional regulator [Rhodocyclaceae bacterium]
MAKPQSHEAFVQELLADPQVRAEYDRLETEFALLREILHARKSAGLTQAQVADRMGTQQASIARLENGLVAGKLPSLSMLKRYAHAVGRKLQVRFVT